MSLSLLSSSLPISPQSSQEKTEDKDFVSPKKRKRGNVPLQHDNNCVICLLPFSSSGPHRPSCTLCGHIFGKECIEKWVQTCKRTCPICKQKVSKADLRVLYTSAPLSTSSVEEVAKLSRELEELRKKRKIELKETKKLQNKLNRATSTSFRYKQQLEEERNRVKDLQKALFSKLISSGCKVEEGGGSGSKRGEKRERGRGEESTTPPCSSLSPPLSSLSPLSPSPLSPLPIHSPHSPVEIGVMGREMKRERSERSRVLRDSTNTSSSLSSLLSINPLPSHSLPTPPLQKNKEKMEEDGGEDRERRLTINRDPLRGLIPSFSPSSFSFSSSPSSSPSSRFHCISALTLMKSRVMEVSPLGYVLASHEKGGTYGITKISLLDCSHQDFINNIHTGEIRDIKCSGRESQGGTLILTSSLDKHVNISCPRSNSPVLKVGLSDWSWCCSWNSESSDKFFCGIGNTVAMYDIRKTNTFVKTCVTVDKPVCSILHLNHPTLNLQMLLVASCSGAYLASTRVTKILPFGGACTSISGSENGHYLASFRSTNYNSNPSHTVFTIQQNHKVEEVHSFFASTKQRALTRSTLFHLPNLSNPNNTFVAAGDGSHNQVCLWSVGSRQNILKFKHKSAVMDVKHFVECQTHFLASLSENQLVFYRQATTE